MYMWARAEMSKCRGHVPLDLHCHNFDILVGRPGFNFQGQLANMYMYRYTNAKFIIIYTCIMIKFRNLGQHNVIINTH